MAQVTNGQVEYKGGEALPEVGSSAYVAAQNGQINPLNSYSASVDVAPIRKSDLTPESPLKLSQPKPSLGYAGLEASIEGLSTSIAEQQKADESKAKTDTAKGNLMDQLMGRKTATGLQDSVYEAEGVDVAKKEFNDLNQQMVAEQLASRRRIEQIDKTFTGTVEGKNEEVRRIQKESASKQADLAVILMAKQNNYFGAKEIADRKIQAELEEDQNKLEAYKLDYEDNKEQFTKDEQRLYESNIRKQERELEKKDAELKQLSDTKLELLRSANEQGAPASVLSGIQNAKDVGTAVNAAGEYGGDILERQYRLAQINKLNVDAKKALEELGTPIQGPLAKAQAQGNIELITSLATDEKLNSAVGPNSFARASFTNQIDGGKSNFIAGVEQLRSQLSLDSLSNAKKNGATFGALSDSELKILSSSASKLGTWAIKNESGDVIGYRAAEGDFKAELNKIANFAKLDYIIKGGDPQSVGVTQMDDNTYWTDNGDGTFTQIQ